MAQANPTSSPHEAPHRAVARSQKRRRRTRALVGVVVLLAVALVTVIGVVVSRTGSGDDRVDPLAGGGCLTQRLSVTADPSLAGAVEAIAEDMSDAPGTCADVAVTEEDSAVTAAALAEGDEPTFDVWIPDSSMWPARAAGGAAAAGVDAAELVVGDTIATTPVVLAATEDTAAAMQAQGAGLSNLVDGAVEVILPDPERVASSSAALLALQTVVAGDARTFTGLVLGLAERVVPTATDALAVASTATTPTVAVTTEQAMTAFDTQGQVPLLAVTPSDAAPTVDVALVTPGDASATTLEAVEELSGAIAEGGEHLAEVGLRDAQDVDGARAADGGNQAEVLRTWRMLTTPSRMLSLNDVSGSMREPVTGDTRRIDLFERAAVLAVNALSSDSSLASWVFSSRRVGAQDWQEIIPFGPLSDPAHVQRTIDAASGLDGMVGGGTGLYDSVAAAVRYMRETYVPDQINLVLLNTDGVNEDDEGLDLPGLLAELEALHDPARPVIVIAVGYGPDTDQEVLEQIADATDGAAYQALDPADIMTVLVDAVSQRGCRPNCG